MTRKTSLQFTEVRSADPSSSANDFASCLKIGLQEPQKRIPSRFFYDARGSELFEEITRQPEYYLTDAELGILEANIGSLQDRIAPNTALIEFGSGSSRKTEILLSNLPNVSAYVAIDISEDALDGAQERLTTRFPNLNMMTIVADISGVVTLPDSVKKASRLGFFPGSTIGNFENAEAVTLMRTMAATLGPECQLVIGVDLKKDVESLHQAYNDAAGVTAAFNRNLLRRANVELFADFDIEAFKHDAHYDDEAGRIDMFLVSQKDQSVRINGDTYTFQAGERVHTEHSYKYTVSEFQSLAQQAGWASKDVWTDNPPLFSVHLLES